MTFQEEQESQIETSIYHLEDEVIPLPLPQNTHHIDVFDEQQDDIQVQQRGSDDTISENDQLIERGLDTEAMRYDSCTSLVEDTQFAGVELDTQGIDRYDSPPQAQRPVNGSESGLKLGFSSGIPPILSPSRKPLQLSCSRVIEKPLIDVQSMEFKFGQAPKLDKMNFSRPLTTITCSAVSQNNIQQPITTARSKNDSCQLQETCDIISHRTARENVVIESNTKLTSLSNDEFIRAAHQLEAPVSQEKVEHKQNSQSLEIGIESLVEGELTNESSGRTRRLGNRPFKDVDAPEVEKMNSLSKGEAYQVVPVDLLQDPTTIIYRNLTQNTNIMPVDNTSSRKNPNALEAAIYGSMRDESSKKELPRNQCAHEHSKLHSEIRDHNNEEIKNLNAPSHSWNSQHCADISEGNTNFPNYSNNSSGLRTNEVAGQGLARRPLSESKLQPAHVDQNESLHVIHGPKAIKKKTSRSWTRNKSPPADVAQVAVNTPITSIDMLQMAMIQASAEKAAQTVALDKMERKEEEIAQLKAKNCAMVEDNKALVKENVKLGEKINAAELKISELGERHKSFQVRCMKYKEHVNGVIRAQKQLDKDAKKLEIDRLEVEHATALKLDDMYKTALDQMEQELSPKRFTEALADAREALVDNGRMIELLRNDLGKRTNELQLERAKSVTLQNYLSSRDRGHQELKDLLSEHLATTDSETAGREDKFIELSLTVSRNQETLDACLASINAVRESEPKQSPEVVEIKQLLEVVSERLENRDREAGKMADETRNTIVGLLTTLEAKFSALKEDAEDNRNLHNVIKALREENSRLSEGTLARDSECLALKDRIGGLKHDLETCRNQMTVAQELNKALSDPRNDNVLRGQNLDLQSKLSTLQDQNESYKRETQRARADLLTQENSSLMYQQHINELQEKLQQAESKMAAFDEEKKAYIEQSRKNSDILRINMEQNFQSRLKDDTAQHTDALSSLQRLLSESEAKILQKQEELDKTGQAAENALNVANELRDQVAKLETQIAQQDKELDLIQENLHARDKNQNLTEKEIQGLQEQLNECEKKVEEWKTRAEAIALKVARQCKETSQEVNESENLVKAEINKLKQQVVEYRQRELEYQEVEEAVLHCLRKRGLLAPDATLEEWTTVIYDKKSEMETSFLSLSQGGSQQWLSQAISKPVKLFSALSNNVIGDGIFPTTGEDEGAPAAETVSMSSSMPFDGQKSKDAANSGPISRRNWRNVHPQPAKNTDRTGHEENFLPWNETILTSPNCFKDRDTFRNEPNTSAKLLQSPHTSVIHGRLTFPTSEAISRSVCKGDESDEVVITSVKNAKKLDKVSRSVIPDSQDAPSPEQSQSPLFTQPTRKVALRKDSIPVPLLPHEGGLTVTRTEVTEYSRRTSKIYQGTPELSRAIENSKAHKKIQSSNESHVTEVLSESPLSTLSDIDFSEYLEYHEESPQPRAAQSPTGAKSVQRNNLRPHEMHPPKSNIRSTETINKPRGEIPRQGRKAPKSILKRVNSLAQTSESEKSMNQHLEVLRQSKGQNQHIRSVANKRLSQQTNGINAFGGTPYNRMVSGHKSPPRSDEDKAKNTVQRQTPNNPVINSNSTGSSPIMTQPQRNLKKRSLSKVGIDERPSSNKLQRVDKH